MTGAGAGVGGADRKGQAESLHPAGAPVPLEVVELVRSYGPLRAVDGISFSLEGGNLLAIFGPNGAGKSTLLELLAGSLRPTSGEVRFLGEPLTPGDPDWLRRVGVLSHRSFLYGELTAAENLRFYGRLYGLDALEDRVREGLEGVGLAGREGDRVRGFSRGMRQRLALARTLLHDPQVVLLDEPWTGLDAHAASLLREVLTHLRDGRRTVVLVTHNLTRGLELADRVAIQVRGRFRFFGAGGDVAAPEFESFYRETVEGEGG